MELKLWDQWYICLHARKIGRLATSLPEPVHISGAEGLMIQHSLVYFESPGMGIKGTWVRSKG